MKEAIETVVAETPKKIKKGTKVEGAESVEGEVKQRGPRVTDSTTYRLLSGVDETAFRGQRQIVVKALKSLGEGSFTADQIAEKCEGLVSKTPVAASAKYHLKGLAEEGKVEAVTPIAVVPAPAAKAEPVATKHEHHEQKAA